jgi:predicted glutamine amidotransferase
MITEPEHAMLQLAIKAQCCSTPVNADGFGICWYIPEVHVPGVFKDITPAWNNPNLKQISRAIKSPCFFAHVRAASAGGVNYPNCHPFTFKNLSFMHNGTVPYFKQIKRSMLTHVSERAFHLIQGTTDSEMMFAMFVTNYERLLHLDEEDTNNAPTSDPCHIQESSDLPYEYVLTKEDHTQYLVAALRATLRQVHYLTLEHEYKTGVQSRPPSDQEPQEYTLDGASQGSPLPETVAIGRLNLAVSDGQSTCTSRYVSSAPETAHSLYYSTGSRYEITNHQCQVLVTPPASPILLPKPSPNKDKSRVVVVSSEPLAHGFNCSVVPINHMVVSGPKGYCEVMSCV